MENNDIQKKFIEDVAKEIQLTNIESTLKNNEVEWVFDNITYRARPVNYKVKVQAYEKKVEKFTELISSGKYKLEEELKVIYKKQGIDIEAIQTNIDSLNSQKETLLFNLGHALEQKESEDAIKSFRDEIEKINNDILNLSYKKTSMLQYSLENQVLLFVYQWLTTQAVEKKEGDVWVKAWKSVDELTDNSEELVNKAIFNTTIFVGQI